MAQGMGTEIPEGWNSMAQDDACKKSVSLNSFGPAHLSGGRHWNVKKGSQHVLETLSEPPSTPQRAELRPRGLHSLTDLALV